MQLFELKLFVGTSGRAYNLHSKAKESEARVHGIIEVKRGQRLDRSWRRAENRFWLRVEVTL